MPAGLGSKAIAAKGVRSKNLSGKRMPLALAFGHTVRLMREKEGWTQEAFADHCGFFRTYLSRIETGKANPTLNAIEVISLAVNLPISELIAMVERRQFS
jgi:transcriptional regulator with XRE-family HTH domain